MTEDWSKDNFGLGEEYGETPQRTNLLQAILEKVRGNRKYDSDKLLEAGQDFLTQAQTAYEEVQEGRAVSTGDIIDKIATFVKEHPVVVTILEYVPTPIPLPLGWGDYLGMAYAYQDLRKGDNTRGALKMLAAITPILPTRPVQALIDKAMGSKTPKGEDLSDYSNY